MIERVFIASTLSISRYRVGEMRRWIELVFYRRRKVVGNFVWRYNISSKYLCIFFNTLSHFWSRNVDSNQFRRIVKFETLLNKNPPTLFIFLSKIREMKRSLKLKRLIKISTIAISLLFSWQKSSTNWFPGIKSFPRVPPSFFSGLIFQLTDRGSPRPVTNFHNSSPRNNPFRGGRILGALNQTLIPSKSGRRDKSGMI